MAYDATLHVDASRGDTQRPATQPQAGIALAQVVERTDGLARVRMGTRECWARIDACVDPKLIDDCAARGVRVVVEQGADLCVVGALSVSRTLEIDRQGNVDVDLKRFVVRAEEALLQTPKAFLRIRAQVAELFADEVVTRGRVLARILGKTIKLN